MNVDWSNRSGEQFVDIIRIISEALSFEDGARWQTKIEDRVNLLADTSLMGCAVPHECFLYVPPVSTAFARSSSGPTASSTK